MTDYNLFLPAAPRTQPISKVKADVEFGVMQANGDCVGIGICRIITTHQLHQPKNRRRKCAHALALLSVSDEGRLEMFFPRSGMLPCTERAFFRALVFPVPRPVFLSEALREALPMLRQTALPAGLYPIRAEKSGYRVVF